MNRLLKYLREENQMLLLWLFAVFFALFSVAVSVFLNII